LDKRLREEPPLHTQQLNNSLLGDVEASPQCQPWMNKALRASDARSMLHLGSCLGKMLHMQRVEMCQRGVLLLR
jgi:hypothetical protein